MRPKESRLFAQLVVLLPTLALGAVLGQYGVPVGTRVVVGLGFGMMLIAAVAAWQRRHP